MIRNARLIFPTEPGPAAAAAASHQRRLNHVGAFRYTLCFGVSAVNGAHAVGVMHTVAAALALTAAYCLAGATGALYALPAALMTAVLTGLLAVGLYQRRLCLLLVFLVYQAVVVVLVGCYVAFNVYRLAGYTPENRSSGGLNGDLLDSRIQLLFAIVVDLIEFCCFRVVSFAYKAVKEELTRAAALPFGGVRELDVETAFEQYRRTHNLPPAPPKYSFAAAPMPRTVTTSRTMETHQEEDDAELPFRVPEESGAPPDYTETAAAAVTAEVMAVTTTSIASEESLCTITPIETQSTASSIEAEEMTATMKEVTSTTTSEGITTPTAPSESTSATTATIWQATSVTTASPPATDFETTPGSSFYK